MDLAELEDLRRKATSIRDEIIEAAERDCQESLRAIDKVALLVTQRAMPSFINVAPELQRPLETTPRDDEDVPFILQQRGRPHTASGPTALVRDAVFHVEPHFTIHDVLEYIATHHPAEAVTKKAISSAMNKLLGSLLQFVRRPSGREPGVYQVIGSLGARKVQPGGSTTPD